MRWWMIFQVIKTMENSYEMDLVDLGIAKLHFVLGVGCGHFVPGNGGEFAPED